MPELPPVDPSAMDAAIQRFDRERREAARTFEEELLSGTSGGTRRDARNPLGPVGQPLPLGRALPAALTLEGLAHQISSRARAGIPTGIIEDVGTVFSNIWAWILQQFRRITGRTAPAPARRALPRARPLLSPGR